MLRAWDSSISGFKDAARASVAIMLRILTGDMALMIIKGLVSLDRGTHVLYYINDSSLRVYSNVGLVVDI